MISIYTRTCNPLKTEFWKYTLKKILGRYSGPDAVLDSLVRGLTNAGVTFEVNPFRPRFKTVHVLAGIDALKDAIRLKRLEKIEKLLAGPALVINPTQHQSLIASPEIDLILQPAQWVKSYFISKNPSLEQRIRIWPAGSRVPEVASSRSGPWIIYSKNYGASELPQIKKTMKDAGIPFEILEYGSFSRKDFYKKLETASGMVYLSRSESQGIALQEAWIRNVPTLVLQSTQMVYGTDTWPDRQINAPYLRGELGAFFEVYQLADMIEKTKQLKPAETARALFSDQATTKIYLDILNEISN